MEPFIHIYRENGIIRRCAVRDPKSGVEVEVPITGFEIIQGPHDPGAESHIKVHALRMRLHDEDPS